MFGGMKGLETLPPSHAYSEYSVIIGGFGGFGVFGDMKGLETLTCKSYISRI